MKKLFPTLSLIICMSIFSSCHIFKPSIKDKNQTTTNAKKLDGILEAMALEKEKTIDPATGTVPSERLQLAYDYANSLRNAQKKTRGPVSDINWTERGPSNVGGRTRAILYDKNDGTFKTVWAGSVGGGLWKTNDITLAAPVWTKINDFFDNLTITCIAQDPTNFNIMYFSTGEVIGSSSSSRGLGIWKSIDGGVNWNQLPSTVNSTFYYVQKIAIDNSGFLYVATLNGVQKSTDNGTSWTKVLGVGTPGGITFDYATDIEFGSDGDIYAGFGNGGAADPKVFKSDNATFGANKGNLGNWTDISIPGPNYRTEIFTAPSDSNRVYILCNKGGAVVPGMFRSINGGASWNAVTTPVLCDQGTPEPDFTRGQAFYDLIGAVDPVNKNTIYIGGVDGFKSVDSGASWTQITSWVGLAVNICTSPGVYVHADHHAIAFKPGSTTELLWGTDGGVFLTTNSGSTFSKKDTNYNVTQYYGCAAHPALQNYFLAGAQDNGTQKFMSPGINNTTDATGGDGGFCHIDQTNGNIQITSYTNNFYNVSTNGGSSFTNIGGINGMGRFINPTDYDDVNDILYGAHLNGRYEFVSGIGGSNTYSNNDISGSVGARKVSALKVDPNTPGTVWMAYQSPALAPLFVKVDNAGSISPTVSDLSTGLPNAVGLFISSIDVEIGNSNHIILCFSNYGTNSIWETMNGGTTWTSVEGNVPDMPVRWVMLHPDSSDMAFIATDLGVWSTNNLNGGLTNWAPSNNGFANVRVDMLQSRGLDNTLVAATHGRGLWTAMIPHTLKIFFEYPTKTVIEAPSVTLGCRKFKDYTLNATASFAPSSPVTVDVNIDGGATATEFLDFEYTTNGSFVAPSHQVVFNNANSIVPVTVRIYDDQTQESVAENFTLEFNILSGTAVLGLVPDCTFTINDNDDDPLNKITNILSENFESGLNPPAGWTLTGVNTNRWGNKNYLGCGSTINNFTMQVFDNGLNSCGYNSNAASIATAHTLVNASGYTDLQVIFDWTGVGEAGFDSAKLVYSTNIVTPSWIDVPGAPGLGNSTTVNSAVVALPASLNNTSFLLGWQWENDALVGGTSVGFDNVFVTGKESRSIENTLSNDNEYLGPNGDIYLYSADGDIMARIQNLSNHDYGCTQVNIDRVGNSAQFITAETDVLKKVFDKTLFITPTNNNPTGNYAITLYVTTAEKTGFESEGRTWATQGKLFKMPVAINGALLTTPRDFAANLNQNTFLNGFSIGGEFSTGFSGFGVGDPGPAIGAPLASTLISFTGRMEGNNALLNWTSTHEENMLRYEIERSTDGRHFEKAGAVQAKGTHQNTYAFEDKNLNGSKYFYRLKMLDIDLKFEYSNLVVLLSENADEIVVFPNPITHDCIIYTSGASKLKLINTLGKTMEEFSVNGSYLLDMKGYPSAVYFLLDTEKGRTYKLIKN